MCLAFGVPREIVFGWIRLFGLNVAGIAFLILSILYIKLISRKDYDPEAAKALAYVLAIY